MSRTRSHHPLQKLFEESAQPVYALDEQRRIVFCNRACVDWMGLTAEQLVGQRCDYATQESAPIEMAAAAALCPPPQVFLGEPAKGWIVWKDPSGHPQRRRGTFLPLRTEEPASVLVVLDELDSPESVGISAGEHQEAGELHQRLQQLARKMRARFRLEQLVGDSPVIRRVREQVRTAIASRARVLIVGPPGSGREHLARTIVLADDPNVERTLLPLHCAPLDRDTLQSTLHSLSRGDKSQSVSSATVLFLDIDQLTQECQLELASMLRSPSWKARVLATSQRSLTELAAAQSFNRDLAFELSTLVVELPALRDRREDIPILIQRMVEEHNASGSRQLAGFSPAALDRLSSLPWTGNVEELAEVVRESCRSVNSVWIGEADLPARVRAVAAAGLHPRRELETIQLDALLLEVERELIDRAMRQAKGNKSQAAKMLGVSRARLLRRLEQLGFITRQDPTIEFHLEEDADAEPGDDVPETSPVK